MIKMEKIDNKVSLEIEVPKEKVNEALENAYKKVVKTISVPGFRKGKVPRKVLELRFGPEILYNEALDILVDPAYNEAIKEYQLEPINQPEMELVQIKKDEPLIFKVNVEVKPEVELCEYKGITVQQVKESVTSEDVDKYLNSLREQHARLVVVEEGELQEKDLAVIDFEGTIDGEPFEGGKGENYSLEIGSNTFMEEFEKQLIGAHVGEERDFRVTFPADHPKSELAGKEADFHVKVKEIKRPQLPDLDDAFVQELTEKFSTMEEFRADVEKNMWENLKRRQRFELERKIIEKVAAESRVDVPEILVEREINKMLAELEYYLNLQGLTLQQFAEFTEGGLDKIKEERREQAAKRARANLVIDEIIKKEAFEVTDEEIDEKIREIASEEDVDVNEVKERLKSSGRLDMIYHNIRYRKAVDLLVQEAVVEEIEEEEQGSGKPEEEEKAREQDTADVAQDALGDKLNSGDKP
ncbi:MAG: trigger factor [Firmicutes bacterium]|nr:trigger factor [Bacillota bacterium]